MRKTQAVAMVLIAGVAVVLAVASSYVGYAAYNAMRDFHRADQRFAVTSVPMTAWDVRQGLVSDAVEKTLRMKDDRSFRRAVSLFRTRPALGSQDWYAEHMKAKRALAAIAGNENAPARYRSAARNLLGILDFDEAVYALGLNQPQTFAKLLAQSEQEFRNSLKLGPNNADARFNLELLQTFRELIKKPGKQLKKTGAGTTPPGGGY